MKTISPVSRIGLRIQQLLLFKEVRFAVGYLRYLLYRYALGRIKIYKGEEGHLGRDTLKYNFAKIRNSIFKHDRVLQMIRATLAIDTVAARIPYLKTLSIGPRSEGELLLIAGHGFRWSNIRGVDLFSYSPRIDVADMHELPYEKDSFDILFSGWTLGYSDDQKRALDEMVRVVKPGGIICVSQGHDSSLDKKEQDDWVGMTDRSNKIDVILKPVKNNIENMYFRHEITQQLEDQGHRMILAVFSVRK